MADSDTPDVEELAMQVAALFVALLGTLPKAQAGRLLVGMSIAFERLERGGREAGMSPSSLRRARRKFAARLPALVRAAR